ncbi:MAG: hypothetical protein V4510_06030 [bacterium]
MDVRTAVMAVVLAALVAGCAGAPSAKAGDDARAALAAVHFPSMLVKVTPDEPFETVTESTIAWGDGAFGVLSADPHSGLYRMNVYSDGKSYGSNLGMGWVSAEYPGQLDGSAHGSPFLALWNLRDVANDPAMAVTMADGGQNFTVVGVLARGGVSFVLHIDLGVQSGTAVWARMVAQGTRESPFTFHAGGELGFPLTVPANAMDIQGVVAGETVAKNGHKIIMDLIKDYTDRRGSVPDSVDPQTLQLERIAANKEWPANPFKGGDMQNARQAGDFVWTKCSDKLGSYVGLGWDGSVSSRNYGGQNCP